MLRTTTHTIYVCTVSGSVYCFDAKGTKVRVSVRLCMNTCSFLSLSHFSISIFICFYVSLSLSMCVSLCVSAVVAKQRLTQSNLFFTCLLPSIQPRMVCFSLSLCLSSIACLCVLLCFSSCVCFCAGWHLVVTMVCSI